MTCPEGERRAAMPDAEFWPHVLGMESFQDEDLEGGEESDYDPSERCDVCGARGACAYDADGNELIHVVKPVIKA